MNAIRSGELAAFVLVLAAVACLALRVLRRRKQAVVARRLLEDCVASPRTWTGAWIIGVPVSHRETLQRQVERIAEQRGSPSDLGRAVISEGGRLLEHVPGPLMQSESEAFGWVERVGPRLAGADLPVNVREKTTSVFALAYLSPRRPPHTDTMTVIPEYLGSALGATLVACPGLRRDRAEIVSRALLVAATAALVAASAIGLPAMASRFPRRPTDRTMAGSIGAAAAASYSPVATPIQPAPSDAARADEGGPPKATQSSDAQDP